MKQPVTMEMIKELRETTGVGMSKCKEALVEAHGNMQEAIDYLRKKGMASAVKKEGREAKEGAIQSLEDEKGIAFIEMNCETDFVAKNEKFLSYVAEVLAVVLSLQGEDLEQIKKTPSPSDSSLTLEQYRNLVIQALGENIVLKRVRYIPKKEGFSYGVYSHMGSKIVSFVQLKGSSEAVSLAYDIAMHVVAENPEYISREEVPSSVKEREEEIARAQIKGKPENIVEKIVAGKFQGFCDQFCLLCQKFVKDNSLTVEQLLGKKGKELGSSLSISSFFRWKVGS